MTDTVFTTVEFEEGFKRGDETITKVQLRRPMAGELRGLSTMDVIRQEYAAIEKLTPRISMPALTIADVANLSAPDFLELGNAIADFFMSRQSREKAGL
ncbi:MAG: phage tail assembly protein [Caulobacteraceae bacterium]|nr:phage tail assembly protein [Caulobacteraceae bacterium]